jgi:hypothetical protein
MVNVDRCAGREARHPATGAKMVEAPEGTSVVSVLIDGGDSYQEMNVSLDDKAQMIQALRDLADMLESADQVMH